MKKSILSVIVLFSILALFCESADIISQIIWSVTWFTILFISGRSLTNILEREEAHE